MTCEEARELIGGDPEGTSAELLSHLATCPECQEFREQMLALNVKLRQALELDWQKIQPTAPPGAAPLTASSDGVAARADAERAVPPAAVRATAPASATPASATPASAAPTSATLGPATPAARPAARDAARAPERATGAGPVAGQPAAAQSAPGQQSAPQPGAAPAVGRSNVTPFRRKPRAAVAKHKRPRLFAFGVSVAAALLVAFTLWLSRPPESLAAEIVTHVQGEPNSWQQTQPVPGDRLNAVLRKSGVKLGQGMQPIVYASSCWFRGHFVPHFVVMTKNGPVTVMVLLNENVPAAQQFNEEGFSGLLVPVRAGSVAVLSRTPMSLEQPASDVVKALQSAK